MGIFYIIVAVGLLAGVHGQSVNLTTDAPAEGFEEGREVTLTCSAELATFDVLSIRKRTPSASFPVATNQIVEVAFRESQRYSVVYNYFADTSKGVMVLTIKNFDKTDAGTYSCRSLSGGQERESETKDLIVKVPVDDVRMARILPNGTLEDVEDNDKISLTYGTNGGIACIVSLKSYVIMPSVNVSVNGVTSSDFEYDSKRKTEGDATTYEFIYKYMTTEPDYPIHGNKIECVSSTPGFNQQSATVKGEATFKPVITCENIKPIVPLGEDAEVNCVVFSNPHADISVEFGETYMDKKLEVDANRDGKFEFLTLLGDLANRTVSFKIYGISEGLFTQYRYRIKASSTLGVTAQTFSFEEKYISGTSTPMSSWSVTLATLISTLLVLKSWSS